MKATEILLLGIGQAGNNIVDEMVKQNRRLRGICINSSSDDMKPLEHVAEKLVLPSTGGAGRDRDLAKQYLKNEVYLIIETIEKYDNFKHVYIAFGLGGGTGSGITPMLLNLLNKKYPGKQFNLIGALPSDSEGRKAHENTIACWNELMKLKDINIGAFYLLDNNKKPSKKGINKEFATLFNKMLNITKAHIDGVIDEIDQTKLATEPGLQAIYDMNPYLDMPEVELPKYMESSIFVTGSTHVERLGLSMPQGFNKEPIINFISACKDTFEGFSDDEPLMVVSGIKMTNRALEHTNDVYNYKNEILALNRAEAEEEEDIELSVPVSTPKQATVTQEAKSIDELIDSGDDFCDNIMNM